MKIQNVDHKQYISFKSHIGPELQEKILLAQKRQMFSKEQFENLQKIKNDGINAVLELTKKIIIKKTHNKNVLEAKRIISLKSDNKSYEIMDISDVFEPVKSREKVIFHVHKFIKIFDDQFNLPLKIQQAWKAISDK